MTDTTPTRKPTGRFLKLWRRITLRDILTNEHVEPGRRHGTAQRKVRWRRKVQLAAARRKRVARDRKRRAMTKVLQRNRRAKGRDHRHG